MTSPLGARTVNGLRQEVRIESYPRQHAQDHRTRVANGAVVKSVPKEQRLSLTLQGVPTENVSEWQSR